VTTPAVGAPGAVWDVRAWDGDAARWDEFVAADDKSSFCHLAGWHGIMADTLGAEPHFLVAHDEQGVPGAVLPLVHVRSALFGRFLVSMPFLNYGGPLGQAPARARLTEEAVAIAQARRTRSLEMRTRHSVAPPLREQQRRLTVLLPLPGTTDELWGAFPSKLRSQVRRPMKAGFTASFGEHQIDEFYAVFSRTMRDLGTPVLPARFFAKTAAEFAERVILCVIRSASGEPIAAGFGFEWRGEVEITWAGALREYSRDAPNMLLYWSFMEETIRRGARTFNFGRCRPDGGTHRFKRQWGGHDVLLPWSAWSRNGALLPGSERSAYGLASRVWTRLPLNVANAVGPVLSRSLP
jgi:serine/alanine adding enzyme